MLLLVQRQEPASEKYCAAGAGGRRAWNLDRHRALVGSRNHATDVRVIGGAGQPGCRNDTKETNNDQLQ